MLPFKVNNIFLIIMLVLISKIAYALEDTITWNDLIEPININQSINNIDDLNKATKSLEQSKPNKSLDHTEITLTGFVVPIEYSTANALTSFLLVPYYGACIHVPPPPENQIIQVTLNHPQNLNVMDQIQVKGIITIDRQDHSVASSSYIMRDPKIISNTEEHNLTRPIVLLSLASLMLSLGLIIPFNKIKLSLASISSLQGFAGGVLLTISLAALIINFSIINFGYYIAGFVLLYLYGSFFYSCNCCNNYDQQQNGRFTTFAIVCHSIPEYFLIFVTLIASLKLGILLLISLLLHNLPLSISIGISFKDLGILEKIKYFLILSILPLISAISLYLFFNPEIGSKTFKYIICMIAGFLSYVAIFHLIGQYSIFGKAKHTIIGTILGVLVCTIGFFLTL